MPVRDTLSKDGVDGGDEEDTWSFPLGSTFKRTHANVHPDINTSTYKSTRMQIERRIKVVHMREQRD